MKWPRKSKKFRGCGGFFIQRENLPLTFSVKMKWNTWAKESISLCNQMSERQESISFISHGSRQFASFSVWKEEIVLKDKSLQRLGFILKYLTGRMWHDNCFPGNNQKYTMQIRVKAFVVLYESTSNNANNGRYSYLI